MAIRYLPIQPKTQEWRLDALCRWATRNVWHPEKGGTDAAKAKRICRSCTVRAECLEDALANNEQHGIWGGLSVRERRALTNSRRRSHIRRVTDVTAGVRRAA